MERREETVTQHDAFYFRFGSTSTFISSTALFLVNKLQKQDKVLVLKEITI